MARNFFDQVVYSSANEDGRSELLALRLRPGETAVAIAGSGARAFDLLLSDADRVVAVDFNVHQCRLVALKRAAWRALPHPALLSFLGVTGGADRLAVYEGLSLTREERTYWDERRALIESGVLYCGAWERLFRLFALAARPKAHTLQRLFLAQTLEEQRQIWTEWADWRWRLGMRLFGLRWLWKYVLREPGIERIPEDRDLSAQMTALFERCVDTHLFRDNPYLHLLLLGRYAPGGPLPLHLQPQSHARIQKRLDRLELVHARLDDHLLQHHGAIHAFSLSDISSYADDATYARIWQGVLQSAAPRARVCERHFLAPREPLDAGRLRRDPELEERLRQQDDTFIYHFVCGTLS
jgi:S-adenosylmethionine-diacylglycerol 3-amino-3-carboxypropyl transferase